MNREGNLMSMDKSLKTAGGLQRERNVLTRAERIAKLKAEERFDEGASPLGLPKVKVVRAIIKKAKKKEKEEGEVTEEKTES